MADLPGSEPAALYLGRKTEPQLGRGQKAVFAMRNGLRRRCVREIARSVQLQEGFGM